MRTISTAGTAATTMSASSISRSVGAPKLVPRASTRVMALTTAGWLWPRIMGPQEPM